MRPCRNAVRGEDYLTLISAADRALLRPGLAVLALGLAAIPRAAQAQRAEENAVASAEDAFGTTIGRETIGIYDGGNIRGFSPGTAGNFRVEGMYIDIQGSFSSRVLGGETIHVGPSAQGFAFPAPTGIVDLALRPSGAKAVYSALVSTDSFGSAGLEFDAQVPIDGARLSVAAGFGLASDHFANGGRHRNFNVGAVPRWHPAPNVEIVAFANHNQTFAENAFSLYIPTGPFLPVQIVRGRYPGPDFAKEDSWSESFGVLGKARLGEWTLRTGLFRSVYHSQGGFSNVLFVSPDQTTDRQVFAYPTNSAGSFSGEVRLSRRFVDGPRQHLLTGTLRSRVVDAHYGGGDSADLGTAGLNDVIHPPKPVFAFGPLTQDQTRQATAGASYSLSWKGVGDVTAGIQRTHYVKRVAQPGVPLARGSNAVTLPSFSAALHLTKGVDAYGSFVRGLEDAGTAPGYAVNGNMVLPAIRTRQYDFGIKAHPFKGTTLILGYFDISKPYIDLDQRNIYGLLGAESHRGIEASITSDLTKNLRIVAGGVFQRPRVTASPLIAQAVGPRPVNQPEARTRFNINWTLPFAPALTLDAYVNHDSSAVGTVDNKVVADGSTRIGAGARYRFKIGKQSVTARVQVFNIFDAYALVPVGSGVYAYNTKRNVTAYLATDF